MRVTLSCLHMDTTLHCGLSVGVGGFVVGVVGVSSYLPSVLSPVSNSVAVPHVGGRLSMAHSAGDRLAP